MSCGHDTVLSPASTVALNVYSFSGTESWTSPPTPATAVDEPPGVAPPGGGGGGAAAPTAVSRLASPSGTTSSRRMAPHPSGGLPSVVFAPVHDAIVPSELSSSCDACELPPAPTPPMAVFTPPPTAAEEPAEKSNAPTVSAVTTCVALLQSGP